MRVVDPSRLPDDPSTYLQAPVRIAPLPLKRQAEDTLDFPAATPTKKSKSQPSSLDLSKTRRFQPKVRYFILFAKLPALTPILLQGLMSTSPVPKKTGAQQYSRPFPFSSRPTPKKTPRVKPPSPFLFFLSCITISSLHFATPYSSLIQLAGVAGF